MAEKSIREVDNASFDAVTEVITNTTALFLRMLVVLLQQTLRRVGHRFRQARPMDEAIKRGEIAEALFLNDALQVEFDVCLTPNESRITQHAQDIAVADQAPDVIRSVQVFLNK